ncbi:anti-sigma regulatory factor [Thermomonospora amylolytica]|uniref:anti-sigma regulatory factor n=1 Tax=Thermomonospora amylolytica TaxID=1411117 RepID=UPI000E6B733A|nr:anti-sigma regulatory factor [Thermomonospora amylolytica]
MDPVSVDWSTFPAQDEYLWTRVEDGSVAARLRRVVAEWARRLGFDVDRIARVQLAVTEGVSNLHKHARQGEVLLRVTRDGPGTALEMVCVDSGPGIADVPGMMVDGRSSAGTLGVGLGSITRIADHTGLYSLPGRGTVLTARFQAPGPRSAVPRYSGLLRPITGEEECGDAYAACRVGDVVYAVLCDGLGHGALAARAAAEAVRVARAESLPARPADLLERVHRGIAHTRGGAVAVAAVDAPAGLVTFAGVGNVAGWVVSGDRRRGMISVPGIAGQQARGLREHVYELPPGGVVVMHSDGLTGRWGPADFPGLFGCPPLVIAATLLRDAGVRRDDQAVLVIGPPGTR